MTKQEEKTLFEMCVKMGMSFDQFKQTKKEFERKFGEKK